MVAESPKWCSVPLSEIRTRGFRLEAAAHDVDGRAARTRAMGGPLGWNHLAGTGGIATAFVGSRFKRVWVASGGIPIFQPTAVTELDPNPDGRLSPKTPTAFGGLRVHKGQILVTCSGTVGKTGLVSDTLDGQVFSHDLLRITCHESSNIGYLYAFLKSRTGQRLLCGSQYGAVITHIEPEHLANIPVPNAPDELKARIHEAVVKSYALRDESNTLLHRARALLQNALALPPLADFPSNPAPDSAVPQTFSVRLSDLAGRFDGSFHRPVVREIRDRLLANAAEVANIGDPRISKRIILPGRFKRVYVEEGYGKTFIGGKQLGELDPTGKKYLSVAQHGKRIAQQLTLHENMILVTCSGTIGRTALVPRHWDGWTASQHILRIVPSAETIAGFLYVWLSSEWARPLLLRNSYGAVIDEIDDRQLGAVDVPILSDASAQRELNELALRASALRTQAYELECAALHTMETEVLSAAE